MTYEYKWQLSTNLVLNTKRKNPRPHFIVVAFRAVIPELFRQFRFEPALPAHSLDPAVPGEVANILQEIPGVKVLVQIEPLKPGTCFHYSNVVTARVEFPIGTPPKRVRAVEANLRRVVRERMAAHPYHDANF